MGIRSNVKDNNTLRTEYIPETIFFRDKQLKEIEAHFNIIFKIYKENKALASIQNKIITGDNGVGKTAIAKKIFLDFEHKLKREGLNIAMSFVECNRTNTPTNVSLKIAKDFGYEKESLKYKHIESKFDILEDWLKETNKIGIIILDEFDEMFTKSNYGYDKKALRKNIELFTFLVKNLVNRISLITITNYELWENLLPKSTLDNFRPTMIYFDHYTPEQLVDITKYRINLAFEENIVDENVPNIIADYSFKNGTSVRLILDLLTDCVDKCDFIPSNRITEEIIKQVIKEEEVRGSLFWIFQYSHHYHLIYLALALLQQRTSKQWVSTSDVEATYLDMLKEENIANNTKLDPVVYRTVHTALQLTENKGLTTKKRIGRTDVYQLMPKYSPELTIQAINSICQKEKKCVKIPYLTIGNKLKPKKQKTKTSKQTILGEN